MALNRIARLFGLAPTPDEHRHPQQQAGRWAEILAAPPAPSPLWIKGRHIRKHRLGMVWEFMGVFAEQSLAVEACTHDDEFIGPAWPDTALPRETVEWPGCYYPTSEEAPGVLPPL